MGQRQWDESLACLEAEDGSLWKATRDSRKKAPPIPALKGPAKIAYSDADKTDRNFSVRINDTYSSHRPTEAGVAQGTLISPLLFNIYVNDIPTHDNTTLCMFADDTAILASHTEPKLVARAINRHFLVLEDWFSKWKIALNVTKTEAVFFTRKTRLTYPDIFLHNEKIPWSQNTKFLGVTLDNKLTFKQHITRIQGLVIFSDSKSAIEAIRNGETNISCDIITLIEQLHSKRKSCILQWIPAHVNFEGNECADSLAKEARDIEHKCTTITLDDANAVAKHRIMNHTFKKPLVTEFDCPRIITSTMARLRTEHLKGMKIHPDKTRSYVQCKHCPDLQLTPNHILECPTVATKLLKMGMVPLRDSLRELLYSPDAPRIAEAVIKTFDGI
ncbi:RNA-directed DNA polymerase from mobile element jockey [Trichonephila clavipes]|nr:RNA-directed DNA polymerase from mobile element jockey [Trichonephila clavipes]